MRDYERYAARITSQIFEGDNAFFLESGVQMGEATPFEKAGSYTAISYPVVNHASIIELEIVLEASDLYTVKVIRKPLVAIQNIISISTREPVRVTEDAGSTTVERVFAFDLTYVLHRLFYGEGEVNDL